MSTTFSIEATSAMVEHPIKQALAYHQTLQLWNEMGEILGY